MTLELMQFKAVRSQDALVLDEDLVLKWAELAAFMLDGLSDAEKKALLEHYAGDAKIHELAAWIQGLTQGLVAHAEDRFTKARQFLASPMAQHFALGVIHDGVTLAFDQWLKAADDLVEPDEALKWLDQRAALLGLLPASARSIVHRVEFSRTMTLLLALCLAGLLLGRDAKAFPLALRGRVSRLTVVLALMGMLQQVPAKFANAAAVQRFLRHARIAIPQNISQALRVHRGLATRPAFADQYVVRAEWESYELGEIADVRNVLKGEFHERRDDHFRESESDRQDTIENSRDTQNEVQSEERYELAQAIREEQNLNVRAEASVSATMQYPGSEITVNAGGGFDYGSQTSRENASRHAKEMVSRAKSRVIDRKVSVRRQRELVRLSWKELQRLDNTGAAADHIVGVYRWIDRIDRARLFRYPHRYLLEFMVPEPGAWLRFMLDENRKSTPPPTPPLSWPQWLSSSELIEPGGGNIGDYRVLANYFKAQGIEPPPGPRTVSTTLVREPAKSEDTWIKDEASDYTTPPSHYTAADRLAVPNGWEAVRWKASVSSDRRYVPQNTEDQIHGRYTLLIGGAIASGVIGALGTAPAEISGDLPPLTVGEVPVVMKDTNAFGVAASIVVFCQPTAEAIRAWQQGVFDAFLAAQRRQYSDYEAAMGAWKAQEEGKPNLQLSPTKAKELIVSEIKRSILMLLGEGQSMGGTALTLNQQLRPTGINLDVLEGMAPTILFLEQAFEWSAMAYQLYPYYWGPNGGWGKTALLDHPNPELGDFLSAGSSRVVVPARPGFETDVQLYLQFGLIWGGGNPPAPDDPDYLSVAREIMDLQRGPLDGVEVDNWPVRLSTSLVAIDGHLQFPVHRT